MAKRSDDGLPIVSYVERWNDAKLSYQDRAWVWGSPSVKPVSVMWFTSGFEHGFVEAVLNHRVKYWTFDHDILHDTSPFTYHPPPLRQGYAYLKYDGPKGSFIWKLTGEEASTGMMVKGVWPD